MTNHPNGIVQSNGKILEEPTFDVNHVADMVVHVAELPPTVTVLYVNIMWVLWQFTLRWQLC